jgi:hypothetical protein
MTVMGTDSLGESLPLPALLSQLVVAFTIEFDNEFEHQMPHRTTRYGFTPGFPRAPWLVSMAMWAIRARGRHHCRRARPLQPSQRRERQDGRETDEPMVGLSRCRT